MKRLALLLVLVSALSLGACSSHTHTFDNDRFEYDSEYHWHPSTCGHDVVSGKAEHSFVVLESIEPTYDLDGSITYGCSICDYSYTETIDKLEHNYANTWSIDETKHWHACTDEGYEDLRGDEAYHTYESVVTNPTFDSEGYTTYTCTVCGYAYIDDRTAKLEHSYANTWSHDENIHWHACTDEGYAYLRADEGSHQFVETVIPPEKNKPGYTQHKCSVCDYTYNDNEVDPLGYTIQWVNYDGEVLSSEKYYYGDMPSYKGKEPVRVSSYTKYYLFEGWSPAIETVMNDVTYTATYSEHVMGATLNLSNYSSYLYYSVSYGMTYSGQYINTVRYNIKFMSKNQSYYYPYGAIEAEPTLYYSGGGWLKQYCSGYLDDRGNLSLTNSISDLSRFGFTNSSDATVWLNDNLDVNIVDVEGSVVFDKTQLYSRVNARSNNNEYGTVTGSGYYKYGSSFTIKAVPANEYVNFDGWYYNNNLITSEKEYSDII